MLLLKPEQAAFEQKVQRLVEECIRPYAQEIEERDEFPQTSYEAFKESGLLKVSLPPEFGGLGADVVTLCLMVKTVAQVSPASSFLVFVTAAVIRAIMEAGTVEQKERFFREMERGDKLCGFALTEPNFGSDAGSIQTRAVPQNADFILNGTKSYITLGEHAHYYLVFVRTGPGKGTSGISALIVERNTKGLFFGKKERKMGLSGSVTQDMIFRNAQVPAANMLLGMGEGWRVLTENANTMRVWGAGCIALGIAEGAFLEALNFAKKRVQFKKVIGRFQAVQFMLADMKIRLEAVRSLIFRTAEIIDSGKASLKEVESFVSMAKCYASDVAMQNSIDAVQIHGSAGCLKGSTVERLMRDAKAIQIFDGSNQIQRIIVARNMLI
jgi:alkylation response protein AidB-like acyl-CoA dehydrogenase